MLALIYDNLRQSNLKIDMVQNDLSENTKNFYFVLACLFFLWHKISSTSQKIEEILALSNNIRNDISRIRETSQIENERIKRTIADLKTSSERIEGAILVLSDKINEIREADTNQGLNQFSTTNGANTGQTNSATLRDEFKSLVDQKIAMESRSLNSMFDQIASTINISKSTVYNYYHRKTNPRETTVNEIRRWVNGERRNNNLNNLYLILMNV
ncbi:hypothetical protein C2G38_2249584 [Gigaspora rosea]|uniref:Uncharacterized protein n=1 Tax=Gigaspora rosea TaxID=44941 RepID=A0A397UXN3_9GLOM|nr:hypothetical protein C2G38_2249584 [Gigaspora rosea]